MGDAAVAAGVEDRVVLAQIFGDVVGVEDGDLGGFFQAGFSHHGDVHPTDGQDGGAAPGGGGDGVVVDAQAFDGGRRIIR